MLGIKWEYLFNIELAIKSLPFLLEGLKTTLFIALISMVFTVIVGVLLGVARMSKYKALSLPARFVISLMRGTPLLVFIFILYYGLPVIGIEFQSPVIAAIFGISLNSAAYQAENVRSAISSVATGQWEAATTLGLSYTQTMRRIIIPQATRIALPPTFNVFMDVIKGTSLASVITVHELLYNSRLVAGRTFESLTMYISAALIYWITSILLGYIQDKLEKRYNNFLTQG